MQAIEKDNSQPADERGGRIFIDCGPGTHTFYVKETQEFQGSNSDSDSANYVIVAVPRGGSRVIFHGSNARRIVRQFKNTEVSLYGIEFRNGRATSGGGAIEKGRGGALLAFACKFERNVAASSRNMAVEGGGSVKINRGSARFYYCDITNNVGNTGGAVGATSGNLELYN